MAEDVERIVDGRPVESGSAAREAKRVAFIPWALIHKPEALSAQHEAGRVVCDPASGEIPGWDPETHREPRQDEFADEIGYCAFKAKRAREQERDWRERAERFESRAVALHNYGQEGAAVVAEVEEARKRLEEAATRAKERGIAVNVKVTVGRQGRVTQPVEESEASA